MRSKIVAGNWKMNLTFDEAETLVDDILDRLDEQEDMNCEVIICPPFPYLEMLTDYEFDEQRFNVGAQNCSAYDKGAYTGEVSAKMLKSIDVDYCIVGHSERRKYFGETNEILAEKINRLIENNMSPIYCVGEVLEEREAGRHFEVVKEQLEKVCSTWTAMLFTMPLLPTSPFGLSARARPPRLSRHRRCTPTFVR